MIVLEFLEDFLHDGLAEKDGPGVDLEEFAVFGDGCHFAVIEIYHLPVLPHQRGSLLPEIFRIYCVGRSLFHLFFSAVAPPAGQSGWQAGMPIKKFFRQK